MADLAQIVSAVFKGEPYNEAEFMDFLMAEGCKDIKVADTDVPDVLMNTSVKQIKRFLLIRNVKVQTLFVALDAMDVYEYFYLRDGIVYSLDKNKAQAYENSESSGISMVIGGVVFISIFLIGFSLMFGGNDDDYDYDDEPTYYYDSDDKDSDGDVDYDDVEKYLEDSLEEDKNDGDDW